MEPYAGRSIYLISGDRSQPRSLRAGQPSEFLRSLGHVFELLRFSRVRIDAFLIRIVDVGPGACELFLRRLVGRFGFVGIIPGGKVLFVHVGFDEEGGASRSLDLPVREKVLGLLSENLSRFFPNRPSVVVELSTATLWSDEYNGVHELMDVVSSQKTTTIIVDSAAKRPRAPAPSRESAGLAKAKRPALVASV
jgi:hypothetical protein